MSMLETKLLSALSELGNAVGSGLKSDGVLSPPDDLVKAFEEAMQNLDANASNNQDTSQNLMQENVDCGGVDSQNHQEQESLYPGPAEQMPSVSQGEQAQNVDNGLHVDNAEQVTQTNRVSDIPQTQNVTQTSESHGIDGQSSFRMQSENVSQGNQGVNNIQESQGTQSSEELMQELQSILQNITQPGATVNHLELYRAQYIMGMLRMQSQTGMKVSQGVSQGLESVLKQKE